MLGHQCVKKKPELNAHERTLELGALPTGIRRGLNGPAAETKPHSSTLRNQSLPIARPAREEFRRRGSSAYFVNLKVQTNSAGTFKSSVAGLG